MEQIDFYVIIAHKEPLLGLEMCLLFDLISENREAIYMLQSHFTKETTLQKLKEVFTANCLLRRLARST
jgi:hypothetical protein